QILVLDAEGQDEPPTEFSSLLYQSNFYAPLGGLAAWVPDGGSAYRPTLIPNHDYWLVVNPGVRFNVYTRAVTGSESPYFKNGIGPLFSRFTGGQPFLLEGESALSFRMIGTTVAPVGVGPPAPSPSGLRLAVAPNPARGNVSVSWSSAIGSVR